MADDQSRIASTVLFKPGAVYDAERSADGRIILVALVPVEIPTVIPRRIKGQLHRAGVVLKGRVAASAIRSERDSR